MVYSVHTNLDDKEVLNHLLLQISRIRSCSGWHAIWRGNIFVFIIWTWRLGLSALKKHHIFIVLQSKCSWLYYHLILAFVTFSQEVKIWDNCRTQNHFVSSKSRKNNILKSKLSSQVVAPSACGLSCLHPAVLRVSPGGLTETDCRAQPQICAFLVIPRSLEAGRVRGARVRILLQVWTKW